MIPHGDKPRLRNIWIRNTYDYTGPHYLYPGHKDYIRKWYCMGTKQDYPTSGFAETTITLPSIFVPRTLRLHMKIIFHGDKPRLLRAWVRRKCDYTWPQYLRQNMRIAYGNGIPWGQTKVTRNLDSREIRLHWTAICYPEHTGYIWKWYSMGANQDYTKSGFAENTITLGLNIFT